MDDNRTTDHDDTRSLKTFLLPDTGDSHDAGDTHSGGGPGRAVGMADPFLVQRVWERYALSGEPTTVIREEPRVRSGADSGEEAEPGPSLASDTPPDEAPDEASDEAPDTA